MGKLLLLLTALLVLSGCATAAPAGAVPKVAVPETTYDFGNVPVTRNAKDTLYRSFSIRNEGNADLRLSDIQIKTLEGC